MKKNNLTRILELLLIFILILFLPTEKIYSQPDTLSSSYFNINKIFRLELSLIGGDGIKKFEVGKTNDNETITISAGGGFGGKLSIGFYITPLLIASLEGGGQQSDLSQTVNNAKGSFSRGNIGGSLKYLIPVSSRSSINVGVGADYLMGGKFDLDFTKVSNGGHNIYEYKNTAGVNVLAEYELILPQINFLNSFWSLSAGIWYNNTKYKLEKINSNGRAIQKSELPTWILKDMEEIDGSGINVKISFIMHL